MSSIYEAQRIGGSIPAFEPRAPASQGASPDAMTETGINNAIENGAAAAGSRSLLRSEASARASSSITINAEGAAVLLDAQSGPTATLDRLEAERIEKTLSLQTIIRSLDSQNGDAHSQNEVRLFDTA